MPGPKAPPASGASCRDHSRRRPGQAHESDLPKVLQPLAGRPLLQHVVDTAPRAATRRPARGLRPWRRAGARRACGGRAGAAAGRCRPSSSAPATRCAGHAGVCDDQQVLVLYGDVPLVRARHPAAAGRPAGSQRAVALLTVELGGSHGLWPHRARSRAARCGASSSTRMRRAAQRAMREGNTGIMACRRAAAARWLAQLARPTMRRVSTTSPTSSPWR